MAQGESEIGNVGYIMGRSARDRKGGGGLANYTIAVTISITITITVTITFTMTVAVAITTEKAG